MAILDLSDLNYSETLARFKTSVKHYINNWSNRGKDKNPFDEEHKHKVLFHAASGGNHDVTKFMMEEHNADPNVTHIKSKDAYQYPLARCIYNGIGTRGGGSFRDTAIFLMDNSAIPSANDNEALRACHKSSIGMIVGIKGFASSRKPEQGHDKVVIRLLEEPSVAETVFKLKQEQYYFLFPNVADIFVF